MIPHPLISFKGMPKGYVGQFFDSEHADRAKFRVLVISQPENARFANLACDHPGAHGRGQLGTYETLNPKPENPKP